MTQSRLPKSVPVHASMPTLSVDYLDVCLSMSLLHNAASAAMEQTTDTFQRAIKAYEARE